MHIQLKPVKRPLYGYDGAKQPDGGINAYVDPDYPYGARQRCRIRHWLEYKAGHGFRWCSQTERPGTTTWNKPDRSSYAAVAMCLYVDTDEHVQCARLDKPPHAEDALEFVRRFPQADLSQVRGAVVVAISALRRSVAKLPDGHPDRLKQQTELAIWDLLVERLAELAKAAT